MSDKDLRNSVSATHPGEILKDILLGHGMSQKELAAAIGKTTSVVNDILSKKRDINVEIAVLLEAVFEQPTASDWLQYQYTFDIELTRLTDKVKELERSIKDWKGLSDCLNLHAIKKRANLGDSVVRDLSFICQLYGVNSSEELKLGMESTYSTACFKKSQTLQVDRRNINTWILLTRIANSNISLSTRFDISRINSLINRLNDIFYANLDTINRLSETLKEFGIKFFVEKKLDKVPVDGYSFWQGDNPTIVVTTRYCWLDNLAFTVFHELGHIVKHLYNNRNVDFLDAVEGNTTLNNKNAEKEANDFAKYAIWGDFDFAGAFSKILNPFSANPFLKRISTRYQINEGIVAGQYQHYCAEVLHHPSAYIFGSKLKQKIK